MKEQRPLQQQSKPQENSSEGKSFAPPPFQLKASTSAKSPEADPGGGLNQDYSTPQDGHLFVALKNPDGGFRQICICQFVFKEDKREWAYAYTEDFNKAVSEGAVPALFKECFTEAMKTEMGKVGVEGPYTGQLHGIGYWIRDKAGANTVIGIFDAKDVTNTARSFYHVNESQYGTAMDKSGTVNVNREDPNWKRRMPDPSDEVLEGKTDDEKKEALDGTEAERQKALSDLSLFNGMPASSQGTNLVTTSSGLWNHDTNATPEDRQQKLNEGKELILHEILDHLSIPEYEKKENPEAGDKIYQTDFQHDEGLKSGVLLDPFGPKK